MTPTTILLIIAFAVPVLLSAVLFAIALCKVAADSLPTVREDTGEYDD